MNTEQAVIKKGSFVVPKSGLMKDRLAIVNSVDDDEIIVVMSGTEHIYTRQELELVVMGDVE